MPWSYAGQMDPDGPWFRVPLDIQREVRPTEEYEPARSLVDTSLPEDDLFAGVTAAVMARDIAVDSTAVIATDTTADIAVRRCPTSSADSNGRSEILSRRVRSR
ncbi:hypothetical protein GFH48_10450 [Streptomyces fagopyri]|uniref:Uncharacterized protein n=1 Tax=Streptomyces fagopyri TaxID=2662397 RepID=A0A5Q0L9L5_9ACTN|nr:hypothetical protein [Streptomyces fagopyri]QFZ73611.1 hypothetical protein GFH48_10450 [Streptomyces fagopyri]